MILPTLVGALKAVEEFLKLTERHERVFRPLGGLAVPIGWVAWGSALVWTYRSPASVLLFLLGLMAILIALQTLVQRCKT
jgi:hypothetical protein